MKERIVLQSRVPFEDALKPLNLGYWILGGAGFVFGFFKSGSSGAMLLLLLALVLWWIVKANIALHKWRSLRAYTFAVDKQIPYEDLVDKLAGILVPFGIRVELNHDKPQITYRNILLNVVYGADKTFSMPWKQNASMFFLDHRYITSYYNTVAIMSIVGYYVQHLCNGEDIKEILDGKAGNVITPMDNPLRRKNRLRIVAPILVGMLALLVVFTLPGGKEDAHITMVREGHPEAYPDITYGEAFHAFFKNPEWKYFKSEDGRDVVEFTGGMTYLDQEVEGLFQFVIDNESNFTTECFAMNEIPQNNLMLYGVLAKIFESYRDVDAGIIREPVDMEKPTEAESVFAASEEPDMSDPAEAVTETAASDETAVEPEEETTEEESVDYEVGTALQANAVITGVEYAANLRDVPSEAANTVCEIPVDAYVTVTEDLDNGFSHVYYQDCEGYVKTKFLTSLGDVGDTGEYDGYAASQDTGITSWDGNTTWDGEGGIDGMLDSYFTGFEDSMIDAYLNQ